MTYLTIYHKNCSDGLGAALAVRYWLKNDNGGLGDARFMTAQYGDEAPDVTGLDVFVVDFSYPRETLLKMKAQAKSLIVIDHHKTAEAELKDLDFCTFDQSKAGCVLTWEHLYKTEVVPLLFLYLQDRDLWKWELPDSKEVSAALRSYKPFLDEWERFLVGSFEAIDSLREEGRAILRYQQRCIETSLAQKVAMVEIGGYAVPCVNCTHLISELGNELAQGHPFAALYFDTGDGKRVFSLRSTEDGIDVSEIAKTYGGGGHFHAAGFAVARPPVL